MRITTLQHPEYAIDYLDYLKWRLTYIGGRLFIERYLKRYSKREDDAAFKDRKDISYAPTYAKAAINKLKNTLYSRMGEISRTNGPQSYLDACIALDGGVDRQGSSMNTFMGSVVLPELMTMKTVGIYVDRDPSNGPLVSQNKGNVPYIYSYKAEDILTWDMQYCDGQYRYRNVLLRDTFLECEDVSGLPCGTSERYRHVFISPIDGKVHVQFWIPNPDEKSDEDLKFGPELVLDMDRIPFVKLSLKNSLLADVADYQIALMNLASSDVNYVFRANFPTYVEQSDPYTTSIWQRRGALPGNLQRPSGMDPQEGSAEYAGMSSKAEEQRTGALEGRTYPKGTNEPGYISPPPDPLYASIEKQTQMKNEIFELVDIAASQAQPQHASADSKAMDDRGLESGLSMIGLELQYGEREIAKIWALYERVEAAYVQYPSKFNLKTDQQRVDECKALDEIKASAPSRTFAKEVTKKIANTMLGETSNPQTMQTIYDEIDAAEFTTSDPKTIEIAIVNGMVDAETGSDALGFLGSKVVPLAQKEHADRLKRISDAQAANNPAARGVPDASGGGPKDANVEKQ